MNYFIYYLTWLFFISNI